MDYKKSFAAIISFILERDLMDCSIVEIIAKMKVEYSTADFNEAVERQLYSLCPNNEQFGHYSTLINNVLCDLYNEGFYWRDF